MKHFPLLILCAGYGKRMLDLTTNTPKPLLKFKNITLIKNTIKFFQNIGCNEIFINTHFLHQKIEIYINKNFNNYQINLIYEPSILGTGGGIKNIFNYTKYNKMCVVNSDIFWRLENKSDVINFLDDYDEINHCKILLSKKNLFNGLKNTNGDFNFENKIISNWSQGNEIFYFTGLQIVSKDIFQNKEKAFPMNDIWQKNIIDKKLMGHVMESKILHIGIKII